MASADNLEFLDRISGDIFSEVAQRIQESRTEISNIHKRVEVAQSKLDGLEGSRKVTKIFSNSVQVDAESIVDGDMVFYPTHQQNGARRKTPALLSSVSKLGLLIFDTSDFRTPQRQSNSDKSSKSTLRRKHDSEISTDTSIGEADTLPYQDHSDCPWSISSQRDQLERSNPLNFSYMPGLGDIPELDLPLALPDLPGVADDLAYNEDVGPAIAPSLIAALPDLSQLTENIKTVKHFPVPPPPPTFIPVPAPSTKPSAASLDRSNLLSDIRERGELIKLKSSAGSKSSASTSHQAPAGDLRADLFNQLSMRRKRLSSENQEVAWWMRAISVMISPPPHSAGANVSSSDEDEDWE